MRAEQLLLTAVQVKPSQQTAAMLPPADLQSGQATAQPPPDVLLQTTPAAANAASAALAGRWLLQRAEATWPLATVQSQL